jgi:uncharacterized protein (DUF3084 family)
MVQKEVIRIEERPVSSTGSVSFVNRLLENVKKELNAIDTKLTANEQLISEVPILKIKLSKYEKEIAFVHVDLEKSRAENRTLREEMIKKDKELFEMLEELERCRQDSRLCQRESENSVANYKHNLGKKLESCLIEAKDESIHMENLPENERILLWNLRKILKVLRFEQIAE